MKKNLICRILLCSAACIQAAMAFSQKPVVEVITTGTKTSLRGLSIPNDNVIWVSGSNGTVGRSSNAGKNWNWFTVKGYEKTEFRDIEAFDGQTAVIMGVGEPAYILKTTDGGMTWKLVYENQTKGMFLDAMDFSNDEHGIVVGDPINGKIFMAKTKDGGDSWKNVEVSGERMRADSGEAFFAASGTNIRFFRNDKFFLASGGTRSRLFTGEEVITIPIVQGAETTGANSIAVFDDGSGKGSRKLVVVGGDFRAEARPDSNCAYSLNGGKTWKIPVTPPHGYRSCVEYLSPTDLLACGLNGVDYSANSGRDWQWISTEGFNVCRISKYGHAVFLAGNNGKIAKISWR
jgi:photosystem II stability/assembly factor-like uncharacterized protein